MRRIQLVAFLVLAAAVVACGDSGAGTTAPATSLAPATSAPTTTTTPPATTAAPATTAPGTTAAATTTLPPTSTAPTTTTTIAPTTTMPADDGVVAIEVTVAGGVVAGEERYEVDGGAEVRITVVVDTADEVHVHGYDVFGELVPGEAAVIEFTADIPGIFEVELEGSGALLFELVVGA